MYGKMRDCSHGALQIDKQCVWMKCIFPLHHDSAGYRQRTVKPGVEYAAAILLDIQGYHSPVTIDFSIRLYFETWTVAMSRYYTETLFANISFSDYERKYRAVVFLEEIFSSPLDVPAVLLTYF